MTIYHIGKNGTQTICRAKIKCPLGTTTGQTTTKDGRTFKGTFTGHTNEIDYAQIARETAEQGYPPYPIDPKTGYPLKNAHELRGHNYEMHEIAEFIEPKKPTYRIADYIDQVIYIEMFYLLPKDTAKGWAIDIAKAINNDYAPNGSTGKYYKNPDQQRWLELCEDYDYDNDYERATENPDARYEDIVDWSPPELIAIYTKPVPKITVKDVMEHWQENH